MSPGVAAAVFPLVFVAELPDKTMLASLLLAARGRPLAVWVGASAALVVHVVLAVSVGALVLAVLPHRAVDAVAAGMFLAGALFSLRSYRFPPEAEAARAATGRTAWATGSTALGVVFVAEWGDLTQILTANLAAAYRDPVAVGVGAATALVAVSGLAVTGGARLVARIRTDWLRLGTGAALLGLACYSAVRAASGGG